MSSGLICGFPGYTVLWLYGYAEITLAITHNPSNRTIPPTATPYNHLTA